jgi:predicted transcriptional regulator
VERIKYIFSVISNPEKVIPKFQFQVFGAKRNDFINDILIEMMQQSFSQFPVFDESQNIIELINTSTIARWLSHNLEQEGTIMIEKTKVGDLIPFIEFQLNYKFVAKNTSIYDAYDLFIGQINKEKRNLDAIFITDSGKQHEKLLGLITIEDIAPLIRK